ncbi:hypothetical protein SAMN05421774_107217 [Gemmobacter megaterium]|uniref:Uncharacterized protein n=2 Tax=Gemmobacter megaterium TaxID=1086013 RepID=A0A1N7Q8C1_9RHOB|nr:hypothetical protein SAMN05421774_107217 [Gemmobacter megaterium]
MQGSSDGDRQMVKILDAVLTEGMPNRAVAINVSERHIFDAVVQQTFLEGLEGAIAKIGVHPL